VVTLALGDPPDVPLDCVTGVGLEPPPPPPHAANVSNAIPNATKETGGFGLVRDTVWVVYRIARPLALARSKVSLTKDSCVSVVIFG
jgi:hypothetical protein